MLQRSVNYNMVNTQNPQQTHQTLHPGPLVSSIAGRIYKSVLSNWEGDHSIELENESDKDLTTFIIPWGQF